MIAPQYVSLFQSFVAGEMTAKQFETKFLQMHRGVDYPWSAYEAINDVFYRVDNFFEDPELFDPAEDTDAATLKRVVTEQLAVLVALPGDDLPDLRTNGTV